MDWRIAKNTILAFLAAHVGSLTFAAQPPDNDKPGNDRPTIPSPVVTRSADPDSPDAGRVDPVGVPPGGEEQFVAEPGPIGSPGAAERAPVDSAKPTAERPAPLAASRHDALHQRLVTVAQDGYTHIRTNVRDYTCMVVKRERVHGRLSGYQYLIAKVRHERGKTPFSVYLKFLGPEDVKGREVLYVAGQNDNKLVARRGGLRFAYITTELDPNSDLAMEDSRYPITEFGLENLLKRLLEHLDGAILENCVIETFQNAKVDGRSCLSIQITNKVKTPERLPEATVVASGQKPRFHIARVYIDNEHQFPIHYEAFDWPRSEGETPRLLEQYTYRNIKLNVGLTDRDFQRANPAYGFRKPTGPDLP